MHTFLVVTKWTLFALYILNPIAGVYLIGKERKPITAGDVVFYMLISALAVTFLLNVRV